MKNTEVNTIEHAAVAVHDFQECEAFPKIVLKWEDPRKDLDRKWTEDESSRSIRQKMKAYRKQAVAEDDLKDLHAKEDHQKFSKWIKMHNPWGFYM